MRRFSIYLAVLVLALSFASSAHAQLLQTSVISLDAARSMAAAAEAQARRTNLNVAISIVDASGAQILFHKMDGVQGAPVDIALMKAQTAARFRRPTKALQDAVAAGNPALMALDGVMPLQGGLPITVDGQVIGGIGISGATAQQDEEVAQAGLNALSR